MQLVFAKTEMNSPWTEVRPISECWWTTSQLMELQSLTGCSPGNPWQQMVKGGNEIVSHVFVQSGRVQASSETRQCRYQTH